MMTSKAGCVDGHGMQVSFPEMVEKENIRPIVYHVRGRSKDTDWSIQRELVREHQIDIQKIHTKYPNGLANEELIDLSNLGLKHLPPQIVVACLNVKILNLNGNNIHWLPNELRQLNLQKLDISGNRRLQPNIDKFSWLLEIPDLVLVANDMGFDFIPKGWRGRFESNQIPFDDDGIDCQAQDEIPL